MTKNKKISAHVVDCKSQEALAKMSVVNTDEFGAMASVRARHGFTLPEVIVAFSVLVMVITAATQILVTVLRVNADNVNSLVAYGLAQEGLEAVRFVRDSDAVLGLGFDGTKKSKPDESVWGEKLYDVMSGAKFFTLQVKSRDDLQGANCGDAKSFGAECLPIQLKKLEGAESLTTAVDTEDLIKTSSELAAATLIYKKISAVKEGEQVPPVNSGLVYVQNAEASDPTFTPTQFHRFIRIEPLNSQADGGAKFNGLLLISQLLPANKLRVSSVVSWDADGVPRQVVLTSELTNWSK